jgi:hypothetical protein
METQWVFSIYIFSLLSIGILIFSKGRMFGNGPNWKDTHLYVAPFYLSQDFLEKKKSLKNKFI